MQQAACQSTDLEVAVWRHFLEADRRFSGNASILKNVSQGVSPFFKSVSRGMSPFADMFMKEGQVTHLVKIIVCLDK